MRIIQPYPLNITTAPVPPEERIPCPVPVYFIRYRYPHHAIASGYDRLCDYTGETIILGRDLYWLGETVLRLPAIFISKFGGHFEYSRHDFVMELEAIRHFRRHRHAIYHFIYAEKSYKFMSRITGKNGNKLVGTVHHPPEHYSWLFRNMDHFLCLDLLTVVSRSQLSFWTNLLGTERIHYVPYAVDTQYFTPSFEAHSEDRHRCIFIGTHERDFDSLAELVPLVLGANPTTEFIMISRDSRCGEIAARHRMAQWRREVSGQEYLRILRTSDLLVLPLVRSTTNTSVLEAMACGLPVITNVGGIEDYLDPECCQVFPVGDISGMAQAVTRLLNDDAERCRMSAAARRRACEFSWPNTARKMVALYKKLMSFDK